MIIKRNFVGLFVGRNFLYKMKKQKSQKKFRTYVRTDVRTDVRVQWRQYPIRSKLRGVKMKEKGEIKFYPPTPLSRQNGVNNQIMKNFHTTILENHLEMLNAKFLEILSRTVKSWLFFTKLDLNSSSVVFKGVGG